MRSQPEDSGRRAPERATFILRLVRERRSGAGWRGEVEHVQSGERRSVGDPGDALSAVRRWLDAPSAPLDE